MNVRQDSSEQRDDLPLDASRTSVKKLNKRKKNYANLKFSIQLTQVILLFGYKVYLYEVLYESVLGG